MEKLIKSLLTRTLPYPSRLRMALKSARLTNGIRGLIPSGFQPLLQLIPHNIPPQVKLPRFFPADGKRRGEVALLSGCAQQVLAPEINLATIKLLNYSGYDVHIPDQQGCCGSILMHSGNEAAAKKLA